MAHEKFILPFPKSRLVQLLPFLSAPQERADRTEKDLEVIEHGLCTRASGFFHISRQNNLKVLYREKGIYTGKHHHLYTT